MIMLRFEREKKKEKRKKSVTRGARILK